MKDSLLAISLFLTGIFVMFCMWVGLDYMAWNNTNPLHLELKNVGSSEISYEVYVDGHSVQSGNIHVNETIIYEQSKPSWNPFAPVPHEIFLVSIVTPHTVHERIVDTTLERTAYFVLD